MNNSDFDRFYGRIKALLADTSPLSADCGVLCGNRCCSGTENDGMLLFPGETTDFYVKTMGERQLAVCNGSCNRNDRPLSCMIFPFFPIIDGKGRIKVEFDYRGVSVCPLIENSDKVLFNKKFIKSLKKAGKMLAKDPDCRRFLEEITGEIKDAEELYRKLK